MQYIHSFLAKHYLSAFNFICSSCIFFEIIGDVSVSWVVECGRKYLDREREEKRGEAGVGVGGVGGKASGGLGWGRVGDGVVEEDGDQINL